MLLQGADGKAKGGQRVCISMGKQRKMEMAGGGGIGEAEGKFLPREKRKENQMSEVFDRGHKKKALCPIKDGKADDGQSEDQRCREIDKITGC